MIYDQILANTRQWVERSPTDAHDPTAALAAAKRRGARRMVGIGAVWVVAAWLTVELLRPFVEAFFGIYPFDEVSPFRATAVGDVLEAAAAITAAILVRRPGVGGQMVVRALLLVLLLDRLALPFNAHMGFYLPVGAVPRLIGSLVALLALGSDRLDRDAGPFQPIACRRELLAAMILSLTTVIVVARARVEWLDMSSGELGPWIWYVLDVAVVAALAVSVVGLYRLRTWGLLLNLLASLTMLGQEIYFRFRFEFFDISDHDLRVHGVVLLQLALVLPLVSLILRSQLTEPNDAPGENNS